MNFFVLFGCETFRMEADRSTHQAVISVKSGEKKKQLGICFDGCIVRESSYMHLLHLLKLEFI